MKQFNYSVKTNYRIEYPSSSVILSKGIQTGWEYFCDVYGDLIFWSVYMLTAPIFFVLGLAGTLWVLSLFI